MYSFRWPQPIMLRFYSFFALGWISAVFCMNNSLSTNLRASSMRL